MTPDKFLPPPLWRRLLLKYILIPWGSLRIPGIKDAWHYWFIDYRNDNKITYLSPGLYECYGLPPKNEGEPLDNATTHERMWDDLTGMYVRGLIALAVRHHLPKWKMPFEIKNAEGFKRLHFTVGFMCYKLGEVNPIATYGWTKELNPTMDTTVRVKALKESSELELRSLPPTNDKSNVAATCLGVVAAHFFSK